MKVPFVLTIACSKGGVGKSTVAYNLAVEFSKKYDTQVIDLDYQKSISIFNYNREQSNLEKLDITPVIKNEKHLKQIIKENTGLIIIDTGAFDSDINRTALLLSDMIIVPTSDSQVDLYGLILFKKVLENLNKVKKVKALLLLNKIISRSINKTTVSAFMKEHKNYFKLFKNLMTYRLDYKKSFETGKSVCEISKSKAGVEIKKIMKEIGEYV